MLFPRGRLNKQTIVKSLVPTFPPFLCIILYMEVESWYICRDKLITCLRWHLEQCIHDKNVQVLLVLEGMRGLGPAIQPFPWMGPNLGPEARYSASQGPQVGSSMVGQLSRFTIEPLKLAWPFNLEQHKQISSLTSFILINLYVFFF